MTIGLVEKLMRYEPLSPLTGEDSEWEDVSSFVAPNGWLWQNRRCSRVFKNAEGAYDVEGRVFREPDGASELDRLRWKAAVVTVDSGLEAVVRETEPPGWLRPGRYSYSARMSDSSVSGGNYDFAEMWAFLNGCSLGASLACSRTEGIA